MTHPTSPRISASVTRMLADTLRRSPGAWATVPTYEANPSAVVSKINTGARSGVFPPGEFEAKVIGGRPKVRYVGPAQPAAPEPNPAAALADELRTRPGDYLPLQGRQKDPEFVAGWINTGRWESIFPTDEFDARVIKDRVYVRYNAPQQDEETIPDAEIVDLEEARQPLKAVPSPQPPHALTELVSAAELLAHHATLLARDKRQSGENHGAAFLDLISEQHTTYAEAVRGLTPTATHSTNITTQEGAR